jgi:hypothetical protein
MEIKFIHSFVANNAQPIFLLSFKMMNVLSLVSYNFLPPKMGGQKCIASFNEWLSKRVNLTCVSTQSNNPALASYSLHNILSNSSFRYANVLYFFTIKKIIKQKNITHLIIEHPYYGWLAFLLKIFLRVKIIVHSHNIESMRFKSIDKKWWEILWYYEKWIHNKADANFFITENDMQYAMNNFGLQKSKCTVITYGFNLQQIPNVAQNQIASATIRHQFNIAANDKILLFNGTLSYKANLNALDIILQKINPLLQQQKFHYKIIVCGKDLPVGYNNLQHHKNIIYAGFVDDIDAYYLATDVFINPVNEGGGIKTKIVEALGFNISLVTTKSGAIGIPENIVGNKMKVIEDDDWVAFANAITTIKIDTDLPEAYFEYFYWEKIAAKAVVAIEGC